MLSGSDSTLDGPRWVTRSRTARIRLGAVALLLIGITRPAWSDDVRPVQLDLKEQEPGLFLMQWQVPQILPPHAVPSPLMPDSCVPDGEAIVEERPGVWVHRQPIRCTDGLAGQTVGFDFPFGNPSLSTVIRVQLLSGERHATLLPATETTWVVPAGVSLDAPLRALRDGVVTGVRHALTSVPDLAFLAAVVSLGNLTLVGVFSLGQLGGVALGALGAGLAPGLAELAMALAGLVLAAQFFKPAAERASVAPVAVVVGLLHGLGWASSSGFGGAVLSVLGMDATLLALGLVPVWLATQWPRIQTALAYGAGIVGVVFTLGGLAGNGSPGDSGPSDFVAQLPELSGESGVAVQASRALSPQSPDAPLQSFVAIEAFEVRHEVLVRLSGVAEFFGLEPDQVIPVEEQQELKDRVARLIQTRHELIIDGDPERSVLDRVDFMTVDPQGVLPRSVPIAESVEEAYVGVTLAGLTPSTAEEVLLRWLAFDLVADVPVTVTDPEISLPVLLTSPQPTHVWQNVLEEDPVPTVSAVPVEPVRVPVPLLSLPLFALALFFAIRGIRDFRDTDRRRSLAWARVTLVLACLLAPVGVVAAALPTSGAPSGDQAERILASILPNVYRAFEFRDEDTAYDRLV